MLELLKAFDPNSQILMTVFPDNIDMKYINAVVGKRCFERMKQYEQVDN